MKSFPFLASGALAALLAAITNVLSPQPREGGGGGKYHRGNAFFSCSPPTCQPGTGSSTLHAFVDGLRGCGCGYDRRHTSLAFDLPPPSPGWFLLTLNVAPVSPRRCGQQLLFCSLGCSSPISSSRGREKEALKVTELTANLGNCRQV